MKCFIESKFLGIRPFTGILASGNIDYILFDDNKLIDSIFHDRADLIDKNNDSITIGKCVNDEIPVYFVQFGIKITKSYLAYLVFIFDHHPSEGDVLSVLDLMPDIVNQSLDNIDISSLSSIN